MTAKNKALVALLISVLLWSGQSVAAKTTLLEVPSLILFFLRMLVALVFFLPFFVYYKPWKKKQFKKLVVISLFSSVNVGFFMWGVEFTSATASQLIYAIIPVLILIENSFLSGIRYPLYKIIGILISLSGVLYIVYLSILEKGATITGSPIGNLAIIVAMLGWTFYIIFAKKLSEQFTPFEIGSTSVVVSFILSIPFGLYQLIISRPVIHLSPVSIFGIFYLGFFGTFLAYIFYQFGLRHGTTLMASLTGYLQPVATGIIAGILIGEHVTTGFLIGGLIVFAGLFLATTYEFYMRR